MRGILKTPLAVIILISLAESFFSTLITSCSILLNKSLNCLAGMTTSPSTPSVTGSVVLIEKFKSIAINSKTLSRTIRCKPENIGALGLEEIAFLTILTPLANKADSTENFMLVSSLFLL